MDAIEDYLAKPWLKHYQQGVPETVDVPLESIPQAFDKATERAPERRAVVFYGREISYRELRDATDEILAFAGLPTGPETIATILTASFGSLFMGLWANRPIAVAKSNSTERPCDSGDRRKPSDGASR